MTYIAKIPSRKVVPIYLLTSRMKIPICSYCFPKEVLFLKLFVLLIYISLNTNDTEHFFHFLNGYFFFSYFCALPLYVLCPLFYWANNNVNNVKSFYDKDSNPLLNVNIFAQFINVWFLLKYDCVSYDVITGKGV